MFRLVGKWLVPACFGMIVAAAVAQAAADDGDKAALVEKYLPDDTACLMVVNVRQVLDHPIVREYYLSRLREMLDKMSVDAELLLDLLAIDPLRDISLVVLAAPRFGPNPEAFLFVIHGDFDRQKIGGVWREMAEKGAGKLQEVDGGRGRKCSVFETGTEEKKPISWAMLDQHTLMLSPRKDYVLNGIAKYAGRKKTEFTSDRFRELFSRIDGKQSAWMVMLASALYDDKGASLTETGLESLSGGATLGDNLSVDLVARLNPSSSPDKAAAEARQDMLKAKGYLVDASKQWKELTPMVELMDILEVTAHGQSITLKGELTVDLIEKSLERLAPEQARFNKDTYHRVLRSTVLMAVPETGAIGTGFLVHLPGKLVLTNYHVVGESREALALFPIYRNGRLVAERDPYMEAFRRDEAIRARVLARDSRRDLALVRLDSVPQQAEALTLAGGSADVTDAVHAVGNADVGALWVYSTGTVRQVANRQFRSHSRKSADRPFDVDARVVLADCPINPGDSGGPLLNDRGEVVGITQGEPESARRVSIFIDVSEIQAFLSDPKLDRPTTFVVRVPPGAKVTIDGVPMQQRGEVRRFQTPPLSLTRKCSYTLTATWEEGGTPVTREKTVDYFAGETVSVDLR